MEEHTSRTIETFELVIDHAEWDEVTRRVIGFRGDDERDPTGLVIVTAAGGTRCWWATDPWRLARLCTAHDDGNYTLAISPRLLDAWPIAAGSTGQATLTLDNRNGRIYTVLSGPGGSFTAPLRSVDVPPVIQLATEFDQQPGASITVDAVGLHQLVGVSTRAPLGPFLAEDRTPPPYCVAVTPDGLEIAIDWHELGPTLHRLTGTATGSGELVVNPRLMSDAVSQLEPGEVTLVLPDNPSGPLRIEQGAQSLYVLPEDPRAPLVAAVNEVLSSCFGPEVVHTDADGDYVLSLFGVPVYGRLIHGAPTRLAIFANAVHDIDPTPELLAELNDINGGYGFVRTRLVDRTIVVEGDLVASTLDPAEVEATFHRVRHVADEVAPTIAALHGGRTPQRGEQSRWAAYTRTTIAAELSPGAFTDLSGDDAVDPWPFDGKVHVITAWNPFGRFRPEPHNLEQNACLAADLVRAGGTVVRTRATSLDGAHSEPSYLTWGLDTATVLGIADRYDQEAIFRLDADTLEVLAVHDQRSAARPRTEPHHEPGASA